MTNTMYHTTSKSIHTRQAARHWPRRAAGVAGAMVAAAAVWVVAVPVLGVDLTVADAPGGPAEARTVGVAAVILSAALAGAAGWGLLGLLERLHHRGRVAWRWIAGTTAVLSLLGPLTMSGSAAAAAALAAMHLATAAVLIPVLGAAPDRRTGSPQLGTELS